nr:hypothetical protein [Tanacetum cinerariifolium]
MRNLLGSPSFLDVYAAVDSCETAKEIWKRVRQMMKGSDIGEQEKKNGWIQVAQNAVQNAGVQNCGNQNGLVVVPGISNQNETGNIVATRARIRRMKDAYLQTQLLIAQKEEAGIQLQAEEFDFMVAADGSAEVQLNNNCYDNEIFNMFTQEEQYMDLLEPIS